MYSRAWNLREKGLLSIKEQVSDFPANWIAAINVVKLTIPDKIVGVVHASMGLLQRTCKFNPKLSMQAQGEAHVSGEIILNNLVDRLGENLIKTRKIAVESIVLMTKCKAFGAQMTIPFLTKKKAVTSKTYQINSNKQLVARYNTLHRILTEHSYQMNDSLYEQSLTFTVNGVSNALQDVRQAAIQNLVELYRTMGDRVTPLLSQLRPAQLE